MFKFYYLKQQQTSPFITAAENRSITNKAINGSTSITTALPTEEVQVNWAWKDYIDSIGSPKKYLRKKEILIDLLTKLSAIYSRRGDWDNSYKWGNYLDLVEHSEIEITVRPPWALSREDYAKLRGRTIENQ